MSLVIHVDDVLISGNVNEINILINAMKKEFRVREVSGETFLGIQINVKPDCIKLSQPKLIQKLLNEFV
ncbi:hypothetical protein, partial [Klebsiella pneumoniae]|uniref:hypothetical protein n=1 Tax=Klebsiella pneumoniae TaxID=573 RepID=UPI004055892C